MRKNVSILKRYIIDFIKRFFFNFIFLFRTRQKRESKYYFTLCAIFKNEAPYFVEWIEYHKIIGVDHIYLYNNFSTDNYQEILRPYLEEGYVTLNDWPYERSQIPAYEHCYNHYRFETRWLMFLDLDEFICPIEEVNIKKWIEKFEKYPSVIMYWLMFGTNGIVEYNSNKLVIEQYTNSWQELRNVGKQALNTDFEPDKIYHHHIFCKMRILGFNFCVPMVNEFKKFIVNPQHDACPKRNSIQINHYWSKCLNEYIRKIDKGDMFSLENDVIRKKMDFFYWHEYKNISTNKVIYRFLIELKMKMRRIEIQFSK